METSREPFCTPYFSHPEYGLKWIDTFHSCENHEKGETYHLLLHCLQYGSNLYSHRHHTKKYVLEH